MLSQTKSIAIKICWKPLANNFQNPVHIHRREKAPSPHVHNPLFTPSFYSPFPSVFHIVFHKRIRINAPSRKIFLQKEWFFNILFIPLPCHWWFLLVVICSTKVSEKIWHGKILGCSALLLATSKNILLPRNLKRKLN